MLISNKLHSFRNFILQNYTFAVRKTNKCAVLLLKKAQPVRLRLLLLFRV